MEIRSPSSREDARAAAVAHNCAWREAYDGLLPAATLARFETDPGEETVDRWASRLVDEESVAYVADAGDGVVGYAVLRTDDTKPFVGDGAAELKEIYVHLDHWGSGAGTALLRAGIDALPDAVDRLQLEVFADNEVGRSFYESREFAVAGHGTVEVGGQEYPTAIYERSIPVTS